MKAAIYKSYGSPEVRSLTENGIYITEHALCPKYHPIQLMIGSIIGSKKAKIHLTKPNDSDLDLLRVLIEKCFPLNEIVNAHRHVESGRTKGKIVLKIE